jgi:hypothetical protein
VAYNKGGSRSNNYEFCSLYTFNCTDFVVYSKGSNTYLFKTITISRFKAT